MTTSRIIGALALTIYVMACAPVVTEPWQRPGVDAVTTANDTAECRATAEREAERRVPTGLSSPLLGAAGVVMSQQRDDSHRATIEAARFKACMEAKDYHRGSTTK